VNGNEIDSAGPRSPKEMDSHTCFQVVQNVVDNVRGKGYSSRNASPLAGASVGIGSEALIKISTDARNEACR
jgi:hypothetical protein